MVDNMTKLLSGRITMDPAICHGKPCIRGLRYPVENILAALEFASRLVKVQRIEMLTV